jgi:predicted nucleic acid-binding protein
MATRYVLDTNVALYLLGGRLLAPLPTGEFYLSVISEMEMLSYPSLKEDEAQMVRQLLAKLTVVGLGDEIKNAAIALRKQHRLKLPDAIICATAISVDATLLSNDAQLERVTEITVAPVQFQ